ncbi:MAG: hypothetical protein PHF56_23630 [Desulfuromonadaceae bacterium]|nr:hypothetical protein [Desulfuromonadaceae bacterium]
MKRMTAIYTITIISMLLAGCATSLSKQAMMNSRTDVFSEISPNSSIPAGHADLTISASLKTHSEFECPINLQRSHGTAAYKLVLNVDGQAAQLNGRLQSERSESRGVMDPEAGDGIRYRFGKSLRLKAGLHKVVVALPDDEIAIARELTLNEGDRNSLVVEPIYSTKPGKMRPGMYGTTSFTEGIRSLRVILNGKEI